jgi:ankyrin repeat protein
MTSNADPVLHPSAVCVSAAAHGDPQRSVHQSPPPLPTASSVKASNSASGEKHLAKGRVHNGDTSSEDGAGENESEAETIMLSPAKKAIKTERDDDANNNAIKDTVPARSPSTNGRKPLTLDDKHPKTNGTKHDSEHDGKSPVPTSPSSRTTSRHTKDTSPADSAKSPVQSTTSPSLPTTRGRSSSTVESRKRKLRQESDPKSLEPPRQKAKTEGLKDRSQPGSPPTPGLGRPGRPHKRSQSTQSMVSGVPGRKRREITAITLPPDRWSDSSSENSSSPNVGTPNLAPHTRVKRSSHRALESPARSMPHKRNVDKFGATRLARESEKGNYSEVKAAYNAAPEELDQEDFAGIAPLQKAALHGHSDVVEFLISKGCRTDCKSNDQDTPLIDAVENGHIQVVKLLLHKGKVNPHHQNKKGQRAIDVLDPDDDDAEELEKELKTAMQREIKSTSTDDYVQPATHQQKTASRLLYNEYNTETLIEKAGDGDILAVGELINSNIKPNIACGVAASRGGHYDILSILLASGLKSDPDPSKHSETPMLVAIGRGHLKIVTLLLEQDTFNPTRRNREGKTYYEISEDRRGPKWELERDMLKTAYDNYSSTHRSPRRTKKEAPNPAGLRMKRKSSPRRERSSSPRHEAKRQHISKPTAMSQVPQKSRRLMSGKEMANRGDKRRRRVVSDESSSDESEEEVRRPTKKTVSKPRSYSEGEEQKPVKKAMKAHSEDHEAPKRATRAQSNESDDDHRQRLPSKIRPKSVNPKPTPDADSPDERKPVRKLMKSRPMDEKIKKRRPSNDSIDDVRVKKTPTPSAKSTPAPPEKAPTPEAIRERREEAERQAAEAKKKAMEAELRKREEEEAARKLAEEEDARSKREAEAKAKRLAEEAEAKAAQQREEAEAARKRAEEEARRQAEEEERRQQELIARKGRIARLPRALRRACELGNHRPLHFSGEELGISAVFLPLFYVSSKDLQPNVEDGPVKSYIMSFQAVGILGLPELDLARLEAPYSQWERNPVTRKQRELFLRQYDVALLAQDFCFPMEGTPEFDYAKIQDSIKEARQQFLDMEGLYWIEDTLLYPEVGKIESLKALAHEIRDAGKRRQIQVADPEVEAMREKSHKPRKSFMDVMLGKQGSLVNGIKVNGEG